MDIRLFQLEAWMLNNQCSLYMDLRLFQLEAWVLNNQ